MFGRGQVMMKYHRDSGFQLVFIRDGRVRTTCVNTQRTILKLSNGHHVCGDDYHLYIIYFFSISAFNRYLQ